MPYLDQYPKDERGKPHGMWVNYHYNGKLMYNSNWFHGFKHGFSEGFYDDGTLSYRGYFNMNRQKGYWYSYNGKKYYLCLV